MPKKSYKVILHKQALKELEALPIDIRRRAKGSIGQLDTEPIPSQAQKLKGSSQAYRIRIGDYRLIYEVHVTEIVVYIIGANHRKEVYLRLLRRISR